MANACHKYTGMLWDYDMTWDTVQKYIQNPSTILTSKHGSTNAEIKKKPRFSFDESQELQFFHQGRKKPKPKNETFRWHDAD